jgi:hypothetical protein
VARDTLTVTTPPHHRAAESYRRSVLLGVQIIVMIGGIAAATYFNLIMGTDGLIMGTDGAPSAPIALARPTPDHRPAASARSAPSAVAVMRPTPRPQAAPSAIVPTVPPTPDHRQAPSAVAMVMATPDDRAAPATVAPEAPALHGVPPAPIVAPVPLDPLPVGSAIHLRVVYRPSDPAEGSRVAVLPDRLQSQNSDIASATASAGPAADERVVYFFPNDRAAASRIAASLARMTNRAEPVMLGHANPLPRPGTVEVQLASKVETELNNEGY